MTMGLTRTFSFQCECVNRLMGSVRPDTSTPLCACVTPYQPTLQSGKSRRAIMVTHITNAPVPKDIAGAVESKLAPTRWTEKGQEAIKAR